MDVSSRSLIIVIGMVAAALIAIAVGVLHGREHARRLRELPGQARDRHGRAVVIATMTRAEEARFGRIWNELRSSFVDDPKGVVVKADRLVRELMLKRGYPLADFEQRAVEIAVDHPWVVMHYRAAEALKKYCEREESNTEDYRRAVVHYSDLLQNLLEMIEPQPERAAADSLYMAAR